MAGRIPQQFIDDLLMRIDIIDVIDAFVPLKKAGKNHQACCPFHNEKTPSFTVSQEKQFYHCFGCGANGTAISFLMEHGGMSFPEAVEDLANRCGLTIPKEANLVEIDKDTSELYELMEMIVRFYRHQLREHSEAQIAVDYLKQRGLSGEIAAAYEVGFAPPGWDNLLKNFGQSDAAKSRLEKLGMTIKKDNGQYYDRFRNRIMFPIRDVRNRVIGFGGRALGDDTPKYLNSPETRIFHKGHELYGLYQARKAVRQLEEIYIVEGYMDVVAMAQFQIPNSVATLGTAATSEQIEKLFKKCAKLVFCFDGDKAGIKAGWRALETTLPLLKDGRQCFFQFMPEGEDPDSFVRQYGKDAFEQSASRLALSDYLFQQLQEGLDLATPEGRAAYIEQAKPYIQKLPRSALKQLIIRELSNQTGFDIEQVQEDSQNKYSQTTKQRPGTRQQTMTPVRRAIRVLLNRPDLANQIQNLDRLATVQIYGIEFLIELIEYIRGRSATTTIANIMENWRDTPTEKALMELARSEQLLSEPEQIAIEFSNLIEKLIADSEKNERLKESKNLRDINDLKRLHQNDKLKH